MAAIESQEETQLRDDFYDDPEKLSQLLRQRAGTDNYSFPFTTTTTSQGTHGAIAAPAQSPLLPDPPPQQLHVVPPLRAPPLPPPSRRVAKSSRYVKPKLAQHQSAPTGSEAVVARKEANKMYHSFNGGNVMGDTQPDSQIYKQWTSRVLEGSTHESVDGASLLNRVDEEVEVDATEGQDVVASSPEEQLSPATTSPALIHDDENDEETQPHSIAPLTSPFKVATPAMAGRKRDNQGHILSSAARTSTTPGTAMTASAFFAPDMEPGVGKDLSLTQVFDATQAGTSPFVGAPNEDAVFQRPSPNFTHARRSSPVAADSSPIGQPRIESSMRSSSEPRIEYVTMQQSQERRLRDNVHIDPAPVEQDSWEDSAAVQKQYARRKARERFEKETTETFRKVTAPRSSPTRRGGGRHLLPVSVTKKTKTPSRRRGRFSAYDGPFDDDELEEPVPPTNASRSDHGGESQDELSREVVLNVHASTVKAANKGENKVQVPRTSSHPQGTLSGRTNQNSPPGSPAGVIHCESQSQGAGSQAAGRERVVRSRNSVTIMNSQPDDTDLDTVSRPAPLVIPSSPSTNQYSINQTIVRTATGFTSQLVMSSLPPKPPESSSQPPGEDEDENRDANDEDHVPSSPPAVNDRDAEDNDDVLYDEHNYDEHVSAGEGEVGDNDFPPVENRIEHYDGVAESQYIEGDDLDEAEDKDVNMDVAPEDVSERGGDEIPDTAEQGEPSEGHAAEDPTANLFEVSKLQRQSTVPDSDMMEDTQPSNFAQTNIGEMQTAESRAYDGATPKQTDGTGPYHTAQEHQSPSKSNKDESYSTPKQATSSERRPQFRSLNDIANQPETQSSFDFVNLEIPKLDFAADTEEGSNDISGSSPLRRSAKKRKITYSAKKKSILSPTKSPVPVMKQTASSPLPQPSESSQEDAPSSTMEREERGASAAAKARAKVMSAKRPPLKLETPAQPTRARSKRKRALKAASKSALQSPKSASNAPDEADSPKSAAAEDPDVEMLDVEAGVQAHIEDQDELAEPVPQPAKPVGTGGQLTTFNDNGSDRGEEPTGGLLCPERVLAYWPGQGYYPATCLGYAGLHHVKVRYDEGSMNTLDVSQVRAFDLRIGDHIKVDEIGMKKHVYVVVGFKDKIDNSNDEDYPMTDRHGYQSVVLEVKQRESILPADRPRESETITVPLERIYLTTQLCNKFRDRLYKPTPSPSPAASTPRVSTPVSAGGGVVSPTLSRRGTAGPSMLRESIRAGSVSSTFQGPTSTVFLNMAFAITLQNDEDEHEKQALARLISSNGGQVLNGFYELFDDLDGSAGTPSRPTSAGKGKGKAKGKETPLSSTAASIGLTLREEFKGLHFAALITDTHSRRTKYIQALALNIPCLHHRWLADSITASHPLPFTKYLLPAGLSTFLSPEGVVRSRNLQAYEPVDGTFEDIVSSRDLLLKAYSVLLITGKSKREIERKKPYLFLTYALGPHTVGRCADIAAAKDLIRQGGNWDWVYVDGGVAGLSEAEYAFFGDGRGAAESGSRTGAVAKGKKRKKEHSVEPEVLVRTGEIAGRKVRLVCDEFVIQSLILGSLVEE